jgi:hypothetical protein
MASAIPGPMAPMGRSGASVLQRSRGAGAALAVCLLASACGLDWTVPPEAQDESTAAPAGAGGSEDRGGGGGDAGGPVTGTGGATAAGTSGATGGGDAGQGGGAACVSTNAAQCQAATAGECLGCAMDDATLCGNQVAACDATCTGASECVAECGGEWGCENACYIAWSECDNTCSQLWTCIDLCPDDVCVDGCYASHPAAVAEYRAMQTCMHCNGCGSLHAQQDPEAYTLWCCG